MNLKLLSLGLFCAASVSPFLMPSLTHKAVAGCVAVDVGVQVAIDGSRRGSQSNKVGQQFDPNCNGGTVTSVGKQVCVSSRCDQRRTSNQYVGGSSRYNTGVNTPNIRVKVGVPVHVHNPAANPNFPFNKK